MKYKSNSEQESVTIVLRYCQEIETILGLRFGVKGRHLREKINLTQDRLPNELKQKIIRIMILGERAIHDSRFQINDLEHFSQSCDFVIQELNRLADQFNSNRFKYNLLHLIRQLWIELLLFWLTSLCFHLRVGSLPSFTGYKLIFWTTLACSLGAVLLLGFFLKSRRFHQEKLDQILEKILVIFIILNPIALSGIAIALFLLNMIHQDSST